MKILTDAEIEEATRAAMGAKPVKEITKLPRAGDGLGDDVGAVIDTTAVMNTGGGDHCWCYCSAS